MPRQSRINAAGALHPIIYGGLSAIIAWWLKPIKEGNAYILNYEDYH